MEKIKQDYESILVVSCKLSDEEIAGVVGKFRSLIEENAVLESVEEWGKRKLAYLINKETDGYYVLFNFSSDPDFPAELNRIYNITDGVLRSLVVKRVRKNESTQTAQTDSEFEAEPVAAESAPEAVEAAPVEAE